ncbi:hypothetical protein JCM3770_006634 [Rhodotorula araucariae]
MPLRSPSGPVSLLALVVVALLIAPAPACALSLLPRALSLKTPPGVSPAGDYLCRVEGDCSPCPFDELGTPVCKLYGNRRSLACVPRLGATHSAAPPPSIGAGSRAAVGESGSQQPGDADDDDRLGGSLQGDAREGAALSPAEQELRDALNADRLRVRLVRRDEWDAELALAQRRTPPGGRGGKRGGAGPSVVYTWEACPKVLRQEYHDYFEFILCNLAFAAVGCALLVYRQRTLAMRQFGRLAARIMQTEMT